MHVCVIARCSLYNKSNAAQSRVGGPFFICEKIGTTGNRLWNNVLEASAGKKGGGFPILLHRTRVHNPQSVGQIHCTAESFRMLSES